MLSLGDKMNLQPNGPYEAEVIVMAGWLKRIEEEPKTETELGEALLFLGGQAKGTLPATLNTLADMGIKLEDGQLVHGGRTGSLAVLDGDYSDLKFSKDLGVRARLAYWPAARRARLLEEQIMTRLKSGWTDDLEQIFKLERLNEHTLINTIFATSGAGAVIDKRILDLHTPIKPFSAIMRLAILPSVYELGVEDSIKWFFEQAPTPKKCKTIVISADISQLTGELNRSPGLAKSVVGVKERIKNRDSLMETMNRLNFANVDAIAGLFEAVMFGGILTKAVSLVGEVNVKVFDLHDISGTTLFPSEESWYSLSVFKVSSIQYAPLYDLVYAGLALPVPEKTLPSYSLILPSAAGLSLGGYKYPPRAMITTSLLDPYGVVIAIVEVDKKAFTEYYKERYLKP